MPYVAFGSACRRGGEVGALAVTAQANASPGSTTNPSAPPSGLPPLTVTTGGATIIIFRTVIVTGRSDGYVMVGLSVAHSRTFTLSILKASRSVSTAYVTLKRGHKKLLSPTVARDQARQVHDRDHRAHDQGSLGRAQAAVRVPAQVGPPRTRPTAQKTGISR